MRKNQFFVGFLILILSAFMSAHSARAEQWVKGGANEYAETFVDLDSVTASPDGWTHYRTRGELGGSVIVSENEVRCDQDFSSKEISVGNGSYSVNGRMKAAPWKIQSVYVSSPTGQAAKMVCHK